MARENVGTNGRGAARRATRRPARRSAPRKAPLGVLIWTTLILLILVVFLFNRTTINSVMDRTELLTVLQRSIDNAAGGAPQEPPATAPPAAQDRPQPAAAPPEPAPPATTGPQVVAAPAEPPAPPPEAEPAAPPPSEPAIREQRLFFAAVSDAGEIAVTGVTRTIDDSASPLTATLQTLFAGPVQSELNQGLITMIPPAATLNRVHVSDRIAYVDVSESFRFNPLGREGIDAQLRQLVLSATEFPRVEMVQILIDGRRVDFLGPEGAYIGEPISRAALGSGPRP